MSALARLRGSVGRLIDDLSRIDVLDLAPRMTLMLLVLYAGHYWYLKVPMRVLCLAALLYRPLYRSPKFWFVVTAFMVASHAHHWHSIDNHKYLMTYWCLALFCCLSVRDVDEARRALATNARLLLGLCMLFATLWKTVSPDFADGSFFEFTLLNDGRFENFARIVGGLGDGDVYRNNLMMTSLTRGTPDVREIASVDLMSNARIAGLAHALTWWSLLVEGALAVAFLWIPSRVTAGWRDALLLYFAICTYSIATVVGFGWLLMILGATQCGGPRSPLRVAYLAVFLLMLVYTGAWGSLVVPWIDPPPEGLAAMAQLD